MPVLTSNNYNPSKVHRRAFKSVFVNPSRPAPFKYFLTTDEYASTIGCLPGVIKLWRSQWIREGFGPGVEPIKIDREYRYRWESVTQNTEGTFLALMKKDPSKLLAGKNHKETE
jgi:hypothetical protein